MSIPLGWPPSPCQQSFCHKLDSALSSIRYFVLGLHTPAIGHMVLLFLALWLFKKNIYLFSVALTGSLLLRVGFLGAALFAAVWASRCGISSCCRTRAQKLWHSDFVAPQLVETSQTLYRTRVPCIADGFLSAVPPGSAVLSFLVTLRCERGPGAAGRLRRALLLLFLCYWLALHPTAPVLLHSTHVCLLFRDHCFSGCPLTGDRGGLFPGDCMEPTQVFALCLWKLSNLAELFPPLTNDTE